MKKQLFIATFFILANWQPIRACECVSKGPFLTVAPTADFVALVKVTRYLTFKDIYKEKMPMSMEVQVVSIYKGKETRKKVVVWGDNGILCRPYLSKFKLGNYYVIAFHHGADGLNGRGHETEKKTDYSISVCGDYWLEADRKTQTAKGAVTPTQNQITLAELKKKLIAS